MRTLEERFWVKVNKTNNCWIWLASTTKGGYGKLNIGGKIKSAHRISWYLHKGYWPDLLVLHKCDNRLCVNIEHLFLGTHADNTADCIAKGRFNTNRANTRGVNHWTKYKHSGRAGQNNGRSKLTYEQVIAIRQLFASKALSQGKLAKLFKVSQPLIGMIVRNEIWVDTPENLKVSL